MTYILERTGPLSFKRRWIDQQRTEHINLHGVPPEDCQVRGGVTVWWRACHCCGHVPRHPGRCDMCGAWPINRCSVFSGDVFRDLADSIRGRDTADFVTTTTRASRRKTSP